MMANRSHYLPRNLDKLSDHDRAMVLDAHLRRLEEEAERGIPNASLARSLQDRKRRLVKTANEFGLWLDEEAAA